MDLKTLTTAINQIAEEKEINAAKVFEAIEFAVAAAYKKEYRKRAEVIRAKLDHKTGEFQFSQVKTVVDANTVRMPEEGDGETAVIEAGEARAGEDEE